MDEKSCGYMTCPDSGTPEPSPSDSACLEPPSAESLKRAEIEREEGVAAQAELLQKVLDNMRGDLGTCKVEGWSCNSNFIEHRIQVQDKDHVLDVLALEGNPDVRMVFGGVRTWSIDGDEDDVVLEIPRAHPQVKKLEEAVMERRGNRPASNVLDFVVGMDGKTVRYANLADLPHLFIAAGGERAIINKNRFIDSILCSLLMNAKPDEVQFAIASAQGSKGDGKWFDEYNGLPHLIAPVAFGTEQTIELLRGCVEVHMRKRYRSLENDRLKCENANYRLDKQATDGNRALASFPKLVIIVSEFNDPRSDTDILRCIAKDGPAVGIHLIVATAMFDYGRVFDRLIGGPESRDNSLVALFESLKRRIVLTVSNDWRTRRFIGRFGAEKLLCTGELMTDSGWRLEGKPRILQSLDASPEFRNYLLSYWKGQQATCTQGEDDGGAFAVSCEGDEHTGQMETKAEALRIALRRLGCDPCITECAEGPASTTFRLLFDSQDDISRVCKSKSDLIRMLGAENVYVSEADSGECSALVEVVTGWSRILSFKDVAANRTSEVLKRPMGFMLGIDAEGSVAGADLAALPHVLITGGSAKDRANVVNGILLSMFAGEAVENLRFVLIDSDEAKLCAYADVSCLAMPVMRVPGALRWVLEEMNRRYAVFARLRVRDLAMYTKLATQGRESGQGLLENMAPLVVVVSDLLALFVTYGEEVLHIVTQLAKRGRDVGIHLVVATGVAGISADYMQAVLNNMPHRVVLHVSNETESCEICGAPGSERLLAHGDLLFYDGTDSNPRHIQGFGVLDKEREAVIERLKLKLPEVRVNDA